MKKVGLLKLAIVIAVGLGFVFFVMHGGICIANGGGAAPCAEGEAVAATAESAAAAPSAADVPDTIILAPKTFPKMRKAPSPLSHKKHIDAGAKCTECHHTWDKAKDATPQKCEGCHGLEKEGKKLSLKRAFHSNCQGCHKDLEAKGEKTGPTRKCNDCHVKK